MTKAQDESLETPVLMGRILGPYGVKGWLKIQPYSDRVDALSAYSSWWLQRDERWVQSEVSECKRHGDHLVARLAGCETREQAFVYRGAQVALPRAVLPATPPGEYYQSDLLGFQLRNREDAVIGTLVEFLDNAVHPIMRVDSPRGETLVPFIPSVVDGVDVDAKLVWVDWGVDW